MSSSTSLVLNLFIEYLSRVITESFTISIYAAVILKFALHVPPMFSFCDGEVQSSINLHTCSMYLLLPGCYRIRKAEFILGHSSSFMTRQQSDSESQ
jgi:hypothetical protein